MEITGILAGLSGLRGLTEFVGQRFHAGGDEPAAPGPAARTETAPGEQSVVPAELSAADLHSTSPRELSRLAHRLFAAGAITAGELQALVHVRADLEATGIAPDQSVDVVEWLSEKLNRLAPHSQRPTGELKIDLGRSTPVDFEIRQTRQQLNLLARLERASAAHLRGADESVDAVA